MRSTPPSRDQKGGTAPVRPSRPSGSTVPDEALKRVGDAIEEAIAARIAHGEDIPSPDTAKTEDAKSAWVSLGSLVSIKALLYQRMKTQGVSRAELQRRLGWHREQVDRLFRIEHLSRMDQLEAAAEALGMKVRVGLEAA